MDTNNVSYDVVPKHLRDMLREHGDQLRILAERREHGDVYWDATGDKLFDVALRLLAQRVKDGEIISRRDAFERLDRARRNADLIGFNIEGLPMTLIQYARKMRDNQEAVIDDLENEFGIAAQTEFALDRKDGKLAFMILTDLKSREYNGFDLVLPMQAKS